MKKTKLDLQEIAQTLLTDNQKIVDYCQNSENFEKTLAISAKKLSVKYPELISLKETVLIAFYPTEKGITVKLPYIAKFDGSQKIFNTDNTIFDSTFTLSSFIIDENYHSGIISSKDLELVIPIKITGTAISHIKKYGVIDGKDTIDLDFLEEVEIFTPIKNLPLGKYSLVKNTKKRTKKYRDLLVFLKSDNTIYDYVAVNKEVDKLVSKYGKDTKFEIIDHQDFINDDGKNAVKTIIKNLNFEDDLTDLDLI